MFDTYNNYIPSYRYITTVYLGAYFADFVLLHSVLIALIIDWIKELCTAKLWFNFWSSTSNGLYIIIDSYIPTLNKYMLSKLNSLL